ncbi:BnaC09g13040D [Brassica napus]|uniref:BnaC09g13040D protein n=1 Tax=Brassica napus TaxID=3708 RepID=A0A078GZF3_BRANA|nr:BnaC09g13040D [Brassica napus]
MKGNQKGIPNERRRQSLRIQKFILNCKKAGAKSSQEQ